MSARKIAAREPAAYAQPLPTPMPRTKKKPRAPRVRLTHMEIRRGDSLRLRIAIADDAMAEAGDEVGALIKKIAPSTQTSVVPAPAPESAPELVIFKQHDPNDENYHDSLREHLAILFGSLCDTTLADALEIARQERDRRSDGGN
jgi:hypothetical protein